MLSGTNLFYAIIGYLIVVVAVAAIFGSKKRIGTAWSIYFMLGGWLIGIVAISASPNKRKLPPPNPAFDVFCYIVGGVFALLTIGAFYGAFKPNADLFEDVGTIAKHGKSLLAVGSASAAFYMFTRKQRNEEFEKQLKQPLVSEG